MKHITLKKSLSFLFASTFAFNVLNFTPTEAVGKLPSDYDQIPNYAKDNISNLFEKELLSGYEDGTFRPTNPITRVELISMILRTYNFTENPQIQITNSTFTDYNTLTNWEKEIMSKAYKVGLINGSYDANTQKTSLAPSKPMSREEIVSVLVRAYELVNTQAVHYKQDNLSQFTKDNHEISTWAYDAMNKAVQLGLLNGTAPDTISPKSIGLRVDAALLTNRLFEKIIGSPTSVTLPENASVNNLRVKNHSLPNYYLLEKIADEEQFKKLSLSDSTFEISNKIDNSKTTFFAMKAKNSNNKEQIINVYVNLDITQPAHSYFLNYNTERGYNLYIENVNQLSEALKNLRHLDLRDFSFYKIINATYFDNTYLNSNIYVNPSYQSRLLKETDELYTVDKSGQIINKIKINH